MGKDSQTSENNINAAKERTERIMKSYFDSAAEAAEKQIDDEELSDSLGKQIEESRHMIAALTADYIAVYMIEPEDDKAYVIKLGSGITNKVKDIPESFCYSDMFRAYADNRICDEDRESFLGIIMPEALIRSFAGGRERYELNYRIIADGRQKHYSGLFIRISRIGEPLKLIAGFRNIDDVINVQKQTRDEGLYSAYTSISDAYLSMHRVNVKKNTYYAIKTTDAILKYTVLGSDKFDENVHSIIKGLAKEESYRSALEFLDIRTLDDRMKGRVHLSTRFEGRIAGTCRLHFFKEDTDEDGKLKHVIFAVEVTDEDKFQSVFDVLARGFQNVFWVDPADSSARILKLDGYVTKGLDKENHKYNSFAYTVLLNQYIKDRVYQEDQKMLSDKLNIDNLRRVFAEHDEYIGNYRVQIDGRMHHYQYSYIRITGTDYLVAGFQNIDAIIEEHIEAEKKEREKEEAHQREIARSYQKLDEMRDIFAASRMGIWSIHLPDGKAPYMEADDQMRELLGIAGQELTPEEIYNAWYDNVTPGAVQTVQACVENMINGARDEVTYLWKHLVLGERYVRCGGTARKTADGYVLSGYHYDVDENIREQKRKDEALRQQEEANLKEEQEHAEVISSLSTIYSTIFRAELDTHNYDVLTSVALMGNVAGVGGNFDDVKESVINAFMCEEDRPAMREFLDIATLSDRLKNINTVATEYRNPEGRWFQARFIVKRRDEKGVAKEALYVARDYTDEKEKELEQQRQLAHALAAAQQANKAKSTFLNSMSHDIRTPMNAIIGFTALAQAHIGEQKQVQDYLTKISTSGSHLLSLINDILDMSRIESGTVKLDEKPVHIPDLLHDLRTMIQGLVDAKNQNLYIDTQDVIHEDVITDKLRLNQVLINIVGNAIKFTQPGGDIIIRLIEKPCNIKNYTTYVFSVKDNGIGMSQEFLGHIFETFSREHNSTVSGVQGTGLGMAITKNIVDMMGGDIQVESEEGKGSLFTVTVNMHLAKEPVKKEPITALLGARVLVVDDDLNVCRSVSKMLRDIEMRPDWSTSGKEAIVRAQDAADMKDEYRVYIIDYLMPDMNGIETVRRIRKVISEDVPIIVLTAYDWAGFEQEAREAGVTAFVSKPIFMSELRDVLTQPVGTDSASQDNNKQTYDYGGRRVLLAEDNELNREIATAILEEMGMIVDSVCDGDEAVAAINSSAADRYDLIFMDIQMPKMDGYTATREIRTLPDNRKANIPIVAMTANAFAEDRQKAYASGMNGHIIKPISIREIAEVLDTIFGKTREA